MHLIAHSIRTDLDALAAELPALHRAVRRYPPPVQLALGALEDVRGALRAPAKAALISLAPCQAGSPEVHDWVQQIFTRARAGQPPPRMNPTHTLHVVDNLALSVAAISLGNHEPGVGLGGAPGQAWEALEQARALLDGGIDEVVILAGDQDDATRPSPASGVALVLGRVGGTHRVTVIDRASQPSPVVPHAARPLIRWLAALADGELAYAVPAEDGDGVDQLLIDVEVVR